MYLPWRSTSICASLPVRPNVFTNCLISLSSACSQSTFKRCLSDLGQLAPSTPSLAINDNTFASDFLAAVLRKDKAECTLVRATYLCWCPKAA